ncbi:MAG: sigma-70 family RNA polymerase sigma factor [Bacteroidales bacterium]|nr:sigma-70 family RNA polymerase sigma factor [Bacteroidales bacterium]MCF8391787.1 sigma-70 family RNA polymerase sigma factor [Bacteroidales bacterium]
MTSSERKQIGDAFSKEKQGLLGFIKKRVTNHYEAEDILQDVFYQLTVGFSDLRSMENISSWLYRVAGNRIIDKFRKKRPESFSRLNSAEKGEIPKLEDILPSLENSPDEELFREMIWEEIQRALDEMPAEQEKVFIMHEFEDLSFKEMSVLTGDSVNTLLSRKRYAILFLREKLKPLYNLLNT